MPLAYREDVPALAPKFDAPQVAVALADVLMQTGVGANVLGIHGPWGCGKTTMLEALRKEIAVRSPESIFIRFNAWKFQDREALWRALILHVLGELKENGGDQKQIEELQQSLYRAFSVEEKGPWKLNVRTLIVEAIHLFLSLLQLDFVGKALKESTGWLGKLFFKEKNDVKNGGPEGDRIEKLASILERETVERQVVQVASIEQFLEKYEKLIATLASPRRRIFVFIDDLDRCLPEAALQIFESIKLFLDAPGCAYAVALDRGVIRKGLALRYARTGEASTGQTLIDPDEYIEKTISVSYDIATLSAQDAYELIDEFHLPFELDGQHKELLVKGLGTNPRRVKRFMNALAVQFRLAQAAGAQTPREPRGFDVLLKISIIGYRYSGVFSELLADASLMQRLQDMSTRFRNQLESGDEAKARDSRATALERERPQLRFLAYEEDFWRLMALKPALPKEAAGIAELQRWFRTRPPLA